MPSREVGMRTLVLAVCLCVAAAEAHAGANCAHSQSWQCSVGKIVSAPAPDIGSGFLTALGLGGVLLATRFVAHRRRS
jgi:hypothetical protein